MCNHEMKFDGPYIFLVLSTILNLNYLHLYSAKKELNQKSMPEKTSKSHLAMFIASPTHTK